MKLFKKELKKIFTIFERFFPVHIITVVFEIFAKKIAILLYRISLIFFLFSLYYLCVRNRNAIVLFILCYM